MCPFRRFPSRRRQVQPHIHLISRSLSSKILLLTSNFAILTPDQKATKMSYQIAYDTARAPPRAAALVAFMEDFYRTSDTESQHEKYVQSFTEDATLIMGPKEAKGASGTVHSSILSLQAIRHIPIAFLRKGYIYVQLYKLTKYFNSNSSPSSRPLDIRCFAPTHTYAHLLWWRR